MNKGIIWAVVIVLILIIGGITLFNNSDDAGADNFQQREIGQQDIGYANLESDDDVFNTIENSLDVIE